MLTERDIVGTRFSNSRGAQLESMVIWLAALVLAMLAASPTIASGTWPKRGYQARACGFDMDRDGTFGEPEDCHVCDGVTTDPDSDGMAEDIFYVDCDAGIDSASCGSPFSPCRTIEFAWSSRGDGPGDGAENIVCFRGTCTTLENFSPQAGGVGDVADVEGSTYAVPRKGSQKRDWLYPRNPTMLVGWDVDGDGIYPPNDPDETSVLDGSGLSRAFRLDSNTDYLEMAHFEVREYGRTTDDVDSGFVRFGPTSDVQQFQVFHDLRFDRINQERHIDSETVLINLFPTNAIPQWILFDNLQVTNNGQWFARGAGYEDPDKPDMGPFRFINISRTSLGCNFSVCGSDAAATSFKLWGYMSRIEILDSIWDGNTDNWEPKPNGGPPGTAFVFVDVCSQDWLVRNNLILNTKVPFRIKGYTVNACNGAAARPVDEIVFDSNVAWNTYEPYTRGDHGVRIEPGGDGPGEWVEDVEITNNFMGSLHGWEAAVWSYDGHDGQPPPGTVVISNNTFFGDINRHAAITLGNVEGTDQIFPRQSYVLENNIIAGLAAGSEPDLAIKTTFNATGLKANHNVFDPNARFVWNGTTPIDLAGWRSLSGEDTVSSSCLPKFVNSGGGELHLHPNDTCALNLGVVTASTPGTDIDGAPRLIGALDIGADEVVLHLFFDGFEDGLVDAWSAAVGN